MDPTEQIAAWFSDAEQKESSEPASMSIATVGLDGRPSLRMVLVRGIDERGLIFYTNLTSRKAIELSENPYAALCLHWKSTDRQIRVEGKVELVSDGEADEYFAGRDRESQVAAWASKQSQILKDRPKLESRVRKYESMFDDSRVPRPEFWSGYRVRPDRIEFWEKRPHRLHERTLYVRHGGSWEQSHLYP